MILASNSKTRAEILTKYGIKFTQKGVDFDEDSLGYKNPKDFVYYATKGKMQTAIKLFGLKTPILTADTVVTANNKILRKAKDKDDARKILNLQSGNKVSILTCMIYKSKQKEFLNLAVTYYLFKKFGKNAIELYLQTDEWKGKAGACMVEGFCKKYIKDVIGYESTAMGLCVENLLEFME